MKILCDGSRKRRHAENESKRKWYAIHRARRWQRRFFGTPTLQTST